MKKIITAALIALAAGVAQVPAPISAQSNLPSYMRPQEQNSERPPSKGQQTTTTQSPPSTGAAAPSEAAPANPARAQPPAANNGESRQTPSRPAQAPPRPATAGPKFQMQAKSDQLLLRLTPEAASDQSNLDVVEGNVFATDVWLQNPTGKEWNALRVIITYNPAYFSPISFNDATLAPYIKGEPKMTVDRKLGQVTYETTLSEPRGEFTDPLLFISWKATNPVSFSLIKFGRDLQARHSEIFLNGEPMLGEPREAGDGTVNLAALVIPADPAEALIMQEDPQVYMGTSERIGGVLLSILPPIETPEVGETFTMEVVLDNDSYSMLDGVSMLIEYNPDYIEILDDDWDNWITREINIHDGDYRIDFPWDYHMANAVYDGRGMIEYRVGTSRPELFIGQTGTVARITARALKATPGTAVKFMFSRRPGTRTTEIIYLGEDVLGQSDVKNDGVRSAFFRINPERPTIMEELTGQ